jgi:ATP/maltotriose-dependent transcriptional regulator MalT
MLLGHGGSAVRAATHLMISARPDDRRALAGLDQAAQELLSSSPQSAADLALRALDLTTLSDPDRFDRTVTAIYALTMTGRLDDAIRLVRRALSQTTLPGRVARLRWELGHVFYLAGRPADAVSEAENILSQDGLPEYLCGPAQSLLFRGLVAGHEYMRGRQRAQAVLAGQENSTDDEKPAFVGAYMLLSYLSWAEGRATDALDHAREAVRIVSGWPGRFYRAHPRLQLAELLMGMGRFEEAESELHADAQDIAAFGQTAYAAAPALVRAQLRLAEDRLDDAVAEAQAGLAMAEGMGAHAFSIIGITVLAIVATRRGDLDTAARHIEQFKAQREGHEMKLLMSWGNWGMAVVADARGDRETAVTAIKSTADETERSWLLMTEPSAAAWLTRIALSVADRSSAEKIVTTAERLARDNPAHATLAASAAHARGLLREDAASLDRAAATHVRTWNRASANEDLGALLSRSDPEAAIRALDRAGKDYQRIGALRDAARVRARLRPFGVSHRRWNRPTRPVSGWDSLTDTERDIAALVTQGLTNRQAAAQMYVSPHTIKFHLSQVFRKLGIASRVELVRAMTERKI